MTQKTRFLHINVHHSNAVFLKLKGLISLKNTTWINVSISSVKLKRGGAQSTHTESISQHFYIAKCECSISISLVGRRPLILCPKTQPRKEALTIMLAKYLVLSIRLRVSPSGRRRNATQTEKRADESGKVADCESSLLLLLDGGVCQISKNVSLPLNTCLGLGVLFVGRDHLHNITWARSICCAAQLPLATLSGAAVKNVVIASL